MGTYQVHGMTLRHVDSREADRLITLYTDEQGKLVVLARGIRKISSKLAGSLEPFTEGVFSIAQGARLDTVIGVDVIRSFRTLKADPERLAVASYVAYVLDSLTKERQRDQRIDALWHETIDMVEAVPRTTRQLFVVRWYFAWRLLQLLGHQPVIDRCPVCHQPVRDGTVVFSLSRGGLIHERHEESRRGRTYPLSVNALKLLTYIHAQPLPAVLAVRFATPVAQDIERLTVAYLEQVGEDDYSFAPFMHR